MRGIAESYRTFVRTWWRHNQSWPNRLEPYPGKQRTTGRGLTEDEAQRMCRAYNSTHDPGRLSRKMEYERE